ELDHRGTLSPHRVPDTPGERAAVGGPLDEVPVAARRDAIDPGERTQGVADGIRRLVDADPDALARPERAGELGGRALCDEGAPRDHDHPLAERLDLREDVAREQHRARPAEPADEVPDL